MSKRFRQDFEVEVQARFLNWSFVDFFLEVMKLNLGRDAEARFGHYFEF